MTKSYNNNKLAVVSVEVGLGLPLVYIRDSFPLPAVMTSYPKPLRSVMPVEHFAD